MAWLPTSNRSPPLALHILAARWRIGFFAIVEASKTENEALRGGVGTFFTKLHSAILASVADVRVTAPPTIFDYFSLWVGHSAILYTAVFV